MKSIKLIVLGLSLYCFTYSESYCQRIATIQDLGNQVEKLWEVSIPMPPNPNNPLGLIYAPLKTGIAVLSVDGQSIYCYDYNGQFKWQAPGIRINSSNGSLFSTITGNYLVLIYPISEDEYTLTAYNADGQLLWSSTYQNFFSFSPSGKYLFSNHNPSGGDNLIVLDIATGKKLWHLNGPYWWQAAAGLNDKIAYYSGGFLKVFQLNDGKLLWEKPVEFDPREDFGQVHISLQGNVMAYDNTIITGKYNTLTPDSKRVTYIYNDTGELLWQRTQAAVPEKPNPGRVEEISESGEYIAISYGGLVAIYDIKSHKELWTLNESGLNLITMFTKDIIAFYPNLPATTTILTLKKDGALDNKYNLDQFIDLSYEKRGGQKQNAPGIMPIVVKAANSQMVLSKFGLKFEANE